MLVGVLLVACAPQAEPQPSVTPSPGITPTATPVPRLVRPASATPPGASSAPVERAVTLNDPIEAFFVPGRVQELYTLETDRARRVGVLLEPLDDGDPLTLAVQVFDEAGERVPVAVAELGQPTLRDEWDLPGPGVYTLRLIGQTAGPRALRLMVVARAQPEVGGGALVYGETASGEIAVFGQRDRWTFDGQADDAVLITLAATEDVVLELYGPGERFLASAEDQLALTLPQDGAYFVVVRMYDDAATGLYRLTLAHDAP